MPNIPFAFLSHDARRGAHRSFALKLVPACILGGGAYLVWCDLLARFLPAQGGAAGGVITAIIGAPLFIYLLRKSKR